MNITQQKLIKSLAYIIFILSIYSCGGSGGSSSSTTNTTNTLGHAQALVNNSTCTLTDSANKTFSVTTGASGVATFNGNITTGLVSMVCNDAGTYTDEATGTTKNAISLSAATNYTGGALTLIATPFSDAAVKLAGTPLSANAITIANQDIATVFGMDANFVNIIPTANSTDIASSATSADIIAIMLAGFSQLEQSSSNNTLNIINDLVADLADGNGLSTGGIISKDSFTTALSNVTSSSNSNSTFAGVNISVVGSINSGINNAPATSFVAIDSISFSPNNINLTKGQTVRTNVIFNPINATNKALNYNSNNSNIAGIGNNGLITTINNGETTIIATSSNGKVATLRLSVTENGDISATGINITSNISTLTLNATTTFTAEVLPNNATTRTFIWSSSNPSVAIIDSAKGLITAIKTGTTVITATADDGGHTATTTLEIIKPLSGSLSYSPTTYYEGVTASITANTSGITFGTGTPSYSITNNPTNAGITINQTTGEINIANNATTGITTSTITISSSHGGSAQTQAVINIIALPEFTLNTNTVVVNSGTAVTITPTNTGGDVNTWTITTGNEATLTNVGLVFNTTTGAISGTTTASMFPATSFIIQAANDAGAYTQAVSIDIRESLSGTISYTNTTTIAQGSSTTLAVNESSLTKGTGDISYTLTSTVDGVSVNSATGLITVGTITAAGSHTINVKVESSHGGSATTGVGIEITNQIPTATNIVISSAISTVIGENLVGTYTFTDGDNHTENGSSYSWQRNGANITGATSLTYTITADDHGQTLTFSVVPNDGISTGNISSSSELFVPNIPTIADFSTTIFADANIGDVVGTMTVSNSPNSPTSITIENTGDGLDDDFIITNNGEITVNNSIVNTIYNLTANAANSSGNSLASLTITVEALKLLSKLTTTDSNASDKFGGDVAINGNKILVGADSDDDGASRSGSAYLFILNTTTSAITTIKLNASDPTANKRFGRSVAISGNYVIIGAEGDNSDAGAAYLFDLTTISTPSATETIKLTASDGDSGDEFGYDVAIDDNYAVVGAYRDGGGSAYVFNIASITTNINNATETSKITSANVVSGDRFGFSVAIDNTNILIGSYGDNKDIGNIVDVGSAYIFNINTQTNNITQTAKLVASDSTRDDKFGYDVDLDGNYAIVGAYEGDNDNTGIDNTGAAYLFDISNINTSTATETTKIIATDLAEDDLFASAVAISGNYIVIGAMGHDVNNTTNTGAMYLFNITNTQTGAVTQTAKITADTVAENDEFGNAVAVDENNFIIGVHQDDDNSQSNSGSAYIYQNLNP